MPIEEQPQEALPVVVTQPVEAEGTATPVEVATPEPKVIDRDEQELQTALAEQAKAANPEAATPTPAPALAAPLTATPSQTPAEAATAKPDGNVTAAVISLRKQNQEILRQNLLLQGQVQALASMVKPGTEQPAEQQPAAVVDPIQEVRTAKLALAEKFDAGDISAKDMELQRQALEDQEWAIRQAQMPQQQNVRQQTDLYLEQATAVIESQYPVLNILSAQQLEPLAAMARQQMLMEGIALDGSATATKDLRERIGKLAQHNYGGVSKVTAPAPAPKLSPEAQAREAKIAFAAGLPPNVATMGSAASGGALSDAEVVAKMATMSEDEQFAFMKTMPALMNRINGR